MTLLLRYLLGGLWGLAPGRPGVGGDMLVGKKTIGLVSGTHNGKPLVVITPTRCDDPIAGELYLGLVSGTHEGKPLVAISTQRADMTNALVVDNQYLGLVSGTHAGKPLVVVPAGPCDIGPRYPAGCCGSKLLPETIQIESSGSTSHDGIYEMRYYDKTATPVPWLPEEVSDVSLIDTGWFSDPILDFTCSEVTLSDPGFGCLNPTHTYVFTDTYYFAFMFMYGCLPIIVQWRERVGTLTTTPNSGCPGSPVVTDISGVEIISVVTVSTTATTPTCRDTNCGGDFYYMHIANNPASVGETPYTTCPTWSIGIIVGNLIETPPTREALGTCPGGTRTGWYFYVDEPA